MTKSLVPYSFQSDFLPVQQRTSCLPEGESQGVHLTFPSERMEWFLAKIRAWFADRENVILVGYGTTQKDKLGFLLLEWEGYEIDPLFLAILHEEPSVNDYSVYTAH